jgi:uncharacterized membrane protein
LVLTRASAESFVTRNAPHASGFLDQVLLGLVTSVVVVGALVVWIARARSARASEVEWRGPLWFAEGCVRPLAAVPFVCAALFDAENILDPGRIVNVLIGALLLASSSWGWCARALAAPRRVVNAAAVGPLSLLGAYLAAVIHFRRLAHLRIDSLNARAFDLGIYDNIMHNTAHGHFLGCSLIKGGVHTSAHFDPVLALLAPVYALAPGAKTLVTMQVAWVLSGCLPAYLLARRSVHAAAALAVGIAWLCYPTVHGIILHDFHSFALVAPLFLWVVYFAEGRRWRAYLGAVVLALLVREDVALCVMGIGVWVALREEGRVAGVLTVVAGALYLLAVKLWVMPDPALLMTNSDEVYAYANRFRRLIPEGGGATDAAVTLATNPSFVTLHVLTSNKIASMALFLVPLVGLPLFGGARLWLALWGATFIYLASKTSVSYPLVHYASVLYPALFAALPPGMRRFSTLGPRAVTTSAPVDSNGDGDGARRRLAFAARGVLFASVLAGMSWGALRPNKAFALHTDTPWSLSESERAMARWLWATSAELRPGTSVTASNRLGPFFSSRRELRLPGQQRQTDLIVVHKRDLGSVDRKWIQELLASDRYERVDGMGEVTVYARVGVPADQAPPP